MNRSERNAIAASAFSEARAPGMSGYTRVNCPFCPDIVGKDDRKQCLSFHAASGWYRCWRCDTRGRLDGFDDDDWTSRIEEAPEPERERIQPPETFFELMGDAYGSFSADPVVEYLRKRGLYDEQMLFEARVGFCIEGRCAGRVVVPVIAPDGIEWLGWVARDWTGRAERKYINATGMELGGVGRLYNQAALARTEDAPVLITEGVFDALAYWPDAVAVLGKPTDAQLSTLVESQRALCVVLDGDAHRQAEVLALKLRDRGARAGYVRLPPCKDPDEVPRDWLRSEAQRSLEA